MGSVGDAYDYALAESFVDSFKTELIRDRVRRSESQLELAIVDYIACFNADRLHSPLGNRTPAEHEADHPTAPDPQAPPPTHDPDSPTGASTTPPGSSPLYGSEQAR